jgi:hypothetical protein
MSRSFKKRAIITCSKVWDRLKERAFRRKVKAALHNIETDFDPDADWEAATLTNKGEGDYGTRFGFPVEPAWDKDWYTRMKRK